MTTPWALSITVPHNMAALATSADGQRVIIGPCVTLLGYEETLTSVLLSTGTPKSDAEPLRTCFLRVGGNRVTDVITVETLDFVAISVRVSLSVTFLPEQKDRWFNHENYIQVLVDHLRSIVRSRCRTLSLSALWPQIPAVVRDTILGERAARRAARAALPRERDDRHRGRGARGRHRGPADRAADARVQVGVRDAPDRRPAGAGDAGLGPPPRRGRAPAAGALGARPREREATLARSRPEARARGRRGAR